MIIVNKKTGRTSAIEKSTFESSSKDFKLKFDVVDSSDDNFTPQVVDNKKEKKEKRVKNETETKQETIDEN